MVGSQRIQEIWLNLLWHVVEYYCMGILHPNSQVISSLSCTVKISNYSATCISDHLYSKTTFDAIINPLSFPMQVAYNSKPSWAVVQGWLWVMLYLLVWAPTLVSLLSITMITIDSKITNFLKLKSPLYPHAMLKITHKTSLEKRVDIISGC